MITGDIPKKDGKFGRSEPIAVTAMDGESLEDLAARFATSLNKALNQKKMNENGRSAADLALTLLQEHAPWLFGSEQTIPWDDPIQEVDDRITPGSAWRLDRPLRKKPAEPDPDPATHHRLGPARVTSKITFGNTLYH